jgi:hypothetical protein
VRDPLKFKKRRQLFVSSPLFELALVLVRIDQIASTIVNADHKILLFTLSRPRSPCSEKP